MDESTEAEWKGAEKNFLHELDDLYAYTPKWMWRCFPLTPVWEKNTCGVPDSL